MEVGSILAAGYGIYQAKAIHDVELEKSTRRHQEAIQLAMTQHELEMKTTKQTYLLNMFNSLEQHFQQLNADLIVNSRESERDMFDQRNQSFQVIILSASMMFAGLSSIIVAGDIPNNSGKFFLVAYAITSALSFSFLFLSIVLCFELVSRTSLFMYKRGKMHTRSLRKAMNDTKLMMRDLRGTGRHRTTMTTGTRNEMKGLFQREDEAARRATLTKQCSSSSIASSCDITNIAAIRREISVMSDNEIEDEFDRHEKEIRGYMKRRELLNYSSTISSHRNTATGHKRSFKHFWEESCELWWNLAILFFYAGSLNMLLVLMIYMWAEFILRFDNLASAVLAVVILGLICVLGLVLALLMRHTDDRAQRQFVLDMHAAISTTMSNSKRPNPASLAKEDAVHMSTIAEEEAERSGRMEEGGGVLSASAAPAVAQRLHSQLQRSSTGPTSTSVSTSVSISTSPSPRLPQFSADAPPPLLRGLARQRSAPLSSSHIQMMSSGNASASPRATSTSTGNRAQPPPQTQPQQQQQQQQQQRLQQTSSASVAVPSLLQHSSWRGRFGTPHS